MSPPVSPAAKAREETVGRSVEGRPLVCHFLGEDGPVIFYMASIHGTEGAGTPLLEKWLAWLEAHPATWRGKRVMVMPVANPDGLASQKRFNTRGIDLNRNFPAANRQDTQRFGLAPLTEPESQALARLIEREQPALIVSIHQPLNGVDYDGPPPAAELAARFSEATGLPVDKLGARPGSLGAWFGETLGKPILTIELPKLLRVDAEALWQRYGPGLRAVLEAAPE